MWEAEIWWFSFRVKKKVFMTPSQQNKAECVGMHLYKPSNRKSETPSSITRAKRAGGVTQAVEPLPSSPSATKKEEKERETFI
jgi:hypothetical protein